MPFDWQSRKSLLAIFLVTAMMFSVFLSGCAQPQQGEQQTPASVEFPTKTITIVCPWGQGGGTDAACRAIAESLRKYVDVPVVVVNKPGSNGAIGIRYAYDQPHDGYTILAASQMSCTPEAAEWFKYEDWSPLIRTNLDTQVIVVRADSEYQTLDQYVEAARTKGVTFGTCGWPEYPVVLWMDLANLDKLTPISYDSDAELIKALLAGEVDAIWTEPRPIMDYVKTGQLKVIGLVAEEGVRIEEFPDARNFAEAGWEEVVKISGTVRGFWVPSDVPQPIKDRLVVLLTKAWFDEDHQKFLKDNMLTIRFGYLPEELYGDFHKHRRMVYGELKEKLGI